MSFPLPLQETIMRNGPVQFRRQNLQTKDSAIDNQLENEGSASFCTSIEWKAVVVEQKVEQVENEARLSTPFVPYQNKE